MTYRGNIDSYTYFLSNLHELMEKRKEKNIET